MPEGFGWSIDYVWPASLIIIILSSGVFGFGDYSTILDSLLSNDEVRFPWNEFFLRSLAPCLGVVFLDDFCKISSKFALLFY